MQKNFTTAFEEPKFSETTPITSAITTDFRRKNTYGRKVAFQKYIYENNNEDGKKPVNLSKFVDQMEIFQPGVKNQEIAKIFHSVLENLHNEIVKWNQDNQ